MKKILFIILILLNCTAFAQNDSDDHNLDLLHAEEEQIRLALKDCPRVVQVGFGASEVTKKLKVTKSCEIPALKKLADKSNLMAMGQLFHAYDDLTSLNDITRLLTKQEIKQYNQEKEALRRKISNMKPRCFYDKLTISSIKNWKK